MSNLIPTPIVNKNGVLTTVHKRADLGGHLRIAPLPAPAISFKAKDTEASEKVMSALNKADGRHNYRQYGVSNIESLEYRLDKYQPEVVAAYAEAITKNPGAGFEDLLVSALHQRVSSEKAGFLLFIAQHDDEQEGDWSPDDQVSINYERALDRYYGIKSLEGQFDFDVDVDVYGTDDQRSVNIVSALLKVTNKVYDNDEWGVVYVDEPGSGFTLNNESAIDLIVRRPEDADRIADIMISRKNPDAEVIEELLDSEVPALSDGII